MKPKEGVSFFQLDLAFDGGVESIREFSQMGRKLVEFLWPENEHLAFEVEMCLIEGLSNAFFHAHGGDPHKRLSFQIRYSRSGLTISIFDRGSGFELEKMLSLTDRDPYLDHGRGLKIMAGLMDRIRYLRGKRRNRLILEKKVKRLVLNRVG